LLKPHLPKLFRSGLSPATLKTIKTGWLKTRKKQIEKSQILACPPPAEICDCQDINPRCPDNAIDHQTTSPQRTSR
jgi:hypothetical protein